MPIGCGNGRGLAVSAVLLGVLGGPPARYQATQFACAGFAEALQTTVQNQSGSATVGDRLHRSGTLMVRAAQGGDSLLIEAWYDSLEVVRETTSGRESAETDGFLGGRYRGVLGADGRYQSRKVPFVPDDLATQIDLEAALDEFFPRLPPEGLAVGREWKDGQGFSIRRQDDSRERVGIVAHYSWTDTRRAGETIPAGDTVSVRLDQLIKERGEMAWSDRFGPLSWIRHLTINARIPAIGGVRQGIHSVVVQDVSVIRRFDLESACR